MSIPRMRIVGFKEGPSFHRLRIALNFEKGSWLMLVFEDYIQQQIDDKDMDDDQRTQYVKDHLDDEALFSQVKKDLISLQRNVVFPHVSTPKQEEFIRSFGGVVIDFSQADSIEKLWFVNASPETYNLVNPQVLSDTRDTLLQDVS